MSRNLLLSALLVLVSALAGCAAPSTTPPAAGELAGDASPAPAAPATPAPVVPAPAPAPATPAPTSPATVVTRCATSADCAVKDVGSCCGTMPACVNKDSPTDPAAVQAQCKSKGMVGICGFQEVTACQCDNGQCVSAGPANPTPSSDPAEPVR